MLLLKNQFSFSTSTILVILLGITVVPANTQSFLLAVLNNNLDESDSSSSSEEISNNSTTVESVLPTKRPTGELSQSTMDVITIIWYVATFVALAAFFFLMACSDRRCGRNSHVPTEQPIPPPTPAPSYSEFAPPSYDAVIKQSHKIFVIPVDLIVPANEKTTPDVKFHTINELQKTRGS